MAYTHRYVHRETDTITNIHYILSFTSIPKHKVWIKMVSPDNIKCYHDADETHNNDYRNIEDEDNTDKNIKSW